MSDLHQRIHGEEYKAATCVKPLAAAASASAIASSSYYKWRLVIAYDGTKFSGWQYQESTPTIQCLLERALVRITKLDRRELCLVGASRTDAGVHAWGQEEEEEQGEREGIQHIFAGTFMAGIIYLEPLFY